ncbi:MAG: 3'(2'),5'-bisphosphate nucleotidase CysQ [Alphaproteobacteria bacterium]|nr:3'(2'),5'-bisphosphate nucleotidase CysQ [Alphaproteobacteria bacterium]
MDALTQGLRAAARAAGDHALGFFREGAKTSARVDYKEGGSPVSEADIAANEILLSRLTLLLPQAGWLSEETADDASRIGKALVFIVDPIDGTRAFVNGDPRWGVAAALVADGAPLASALYMPALGEMYHAARGGGAFRNGERLTASLREELAQARLAAPVKAFEELEKRGLQLAREPRIPSLAYRLAKVASGELDCALASTNAWDWDIAASDLLIREAGGILSDLDMRQPVYNNAVARHGVLAAAPARLHGSLVTAIRQIAGK